MSPAEVERFHNILRDLVTQFTLLQDRMVDAAEVFETRGGQPVYGEETLQMIAFVLNPINALVDGDATMQEVIARWRTDFG